MRNKFLTKILGATLGLALAVGVSVGVANNREAKEVHADPQATNSNWQEVTALNQLNGTDRYTIATNDGAKYWNGTINKGHLQTSDFTSSTPANNADGVVKLVSVSGNTWKVQLVSNNNFLIATAAKSGSGSTNSTDSYGWTFSYSSGFNATYQETGKNACLRSYNDSDFRTYANTSSGATFKIYKYQAGKTLSTISVQTAPTKTTYYAGEFFDPTGLVITRNYSDSTSDTYSYAGHSADFTFSPTTSTALTTDNTSVTISYGGKSTSQAITVNPARTVSSVSLDGDMSNKEYIEGDEWDLTGLYLTITWSSGTPNPTTVNLTDLTKDVDYELEKDTASLGDTSLYIYGSYGGEDFEGTITGITVSELPKVVTYTISSKTSVSKTGNAPEGVNASYSQTYNTAGQATGGNSMTLSLSGFTRNTKITGIVMNMKSNASSGAGGLSYSIGGAAEQYLVAAATGFNSWGDNTSYGSSYRNVTIGDDLEIEIPLASSFTLTLTASTNSLYIASYTISYDYLQPRITAAPSSQDVYVGETAVSTVTASYFNSDPSLSYELVSGGTSISSVEIGSFVSHQATVTIVASSTPGTAVVRIKDSANPTSYYADITINVAASAKSIVENTLTTRSTLSYRYSRSGTTDTLTCASIASTVGNVYGDWSDREGDASSAVYAGNTYGGNETAIQMNNSNNASGIVTTTSGGVSARNITVVWGNSTANGRTVDIYGKNTAYESSADLYDGEKQGTKIGSLVKGTSTTIDFSGYSYIGLRPTNGAVYFESIKVLWGEPTYNYSKVAIRFGGQIDPSLWGDLNDQSDIEAYGVLYSPSASIISRYEAANGVLVAGGANYQTVSGTDIRYYETELTAQKEHPTLVDANYVWNLYCEIDGSSNDALTTAYSAVAFIRTANDGIVFFGEVSKSAAELAYDLAHGTTFDADNNLEGSMNHLADLFVPA